MAERLAKIGIPCLPVVAGLLAWLHMNPADHPAPRRILTIER